MPMSIVNCRGGLTRKVSVARCQFQLSTAEASCPEKSQLPDVKFNCRLLRLSMSTEDCLVQSKRKSERSREKRSSEFQLSMSIVNVEPETSHHSARDRPNPPRSDGGPPAGDYKMVILR